VLLLFMCGLLLTWLPVQSKEISPERIELAQEYHDHGIFLWKEHQQTEDSLPFFRAATRLNPRDRDYWTDLGTVELLMNMRSKAKNRFQLALKLDPQCAVCRDKLEEIRKLEYHFPDHTTAEDYENEHAMAINLAPMNTIEASKPASMIPHEDSAGISFHFDMSRPVVIRNIGRYWNLTSLQPNNLAAVYGLQLTETYPQNMRQKPQRLYTMTLQEALQSIELPKSAYSSVDASSSGMYVQWNMNRTIFHQLLDLVTDSNTDEDRGKVIPRLHTVESNLGHPTIALSLAEYLGNESDMEESFLTAMHWYMVTLGERNAGMFFHVDKLPTSSWQVQVSGKKAWRLCPPVHDKIDTSAFMPPDKKALVKELYQQTDFFDHCDTDFTDKCGQFYATEKEECVAGACPNSEDESKESGFVVECYEAVVNAGDLVYYPAYWWHQTLNLDEEDINMAISSSLLSATNRAAFIDVIRAECKSLNTDNEDEFGQFLVDRKSPNYQLSRETCSRFK
jgi:hypothetical protein